MRVGSLVYATDQGLGILAKSFFDAGVVTDVIVVRHGRHPTHDFWYPGAEQITSLRDPQQVQRAKRFCESMDVMLFFETPFLWELLPHAKRKGVKTVVCPMYECAHENLRRPEYKPDLFLCPSLLDLDYFPEGVFIPVPVQVEWRQRTRAEVFVHNAGWGGLKGRNGTAEIVAAWHYVKSPAKLILRTQENLSHSWRNSKGTIRNFDKRIELVTQTVPYDQLYREGDAFLFSEGFNGLSLPLQEARAAGMLVMCGNRHPMNKWLPTAPMIPVDHYRKERIGPPYPLYDRACYDPKTIAATVDAWYGADLTEYSLSGRAWAEAHSWGALKPRYMEALTNLVGA